ncbi:PASTA domain-containing protein [Saccharopolyspora shandongensis]|uniref:PASTA domain-containing protein n=1 Tax=Saccharopolyspora shandongensis TaxID=418495 RepID=UPI00342F2C86
MRESSGRGRYLDYYGDPRPIPNLVGRTPPEALAVANAVGVEIVVGGPDGDPRPLRRDHGRIQRQHPAAGQPIGQTSWVVVWPAE